MPYWVELQTQTEEEFEKDFAYLVKEETSVSDKSYYPVQDVPRGKDKENNTETVASH